MPCLKAYSQGSEFPVPLDSKMVRLYGMRLCPYVHRVRLVLAQKNIAVDEVNINLKNKPSWFLEKSIFGEVPAIELNGKVLCGSLIICDYFDEVYPQNPLWPMDPFAKAEHKVVLEIFTNKISNPTKKFFYGKTDDQENDAKDIEEGCQILSKYLKDQPYFGGDQPDMLDFMMWPWFERFPMLQSTHPIFTLSGFAKLVDWYDFMKHLPVVISCAVSPQIYQRYFDTVKNGQPNYDIWMEESS